MLAVPRLRAARSVQQFRSRIEGAHRNTDRSVFVVSRIHANLRDELNVLNILKICWGICGEPYGLLPIRQPLRWVKQQIGP
jgi:hypothetical protein